jgi:hypothetical protein
MSTLKAAQHRVQWTSAGFPHIFGDSAPGGFIRHIPRLLVTPAVGRLP